MTSSSPTQSDRTGAGKTNRQHRRGFEIDNWCAAISGLTLFPGETGETAAEPGGQPGETRSACQPYQFCIMAWTGGPSAGTGRTAGAAAPGCTSILAWVDYRDHRVEGRRRMRFNNIVRLIPPVLHPAGGDSGIASAVGARGLPTGCEWHVRGLERPAHGGSKITRNKPPQQHLRVIKPAAGLPPAGLGRSPDQLLGHLHARPSTSSAAPRSSVSSTDTGLPLGIPEEPLGQIKIRQGAVQDLLQDRGRRDPSFSAIHQTSGESLGMQ